ncbi:MAG: helix-hairpin-helix domain-containing protein [Alphaproteobacteria bacterium]|nr:helix-hairpin-helix domain-containing protein [Alphaproteobacteria bacterium]
MSLPETDGTATAAAPPDLSRYARGLAGLAAALAPAEDDDDTAERGGVAPSGELRAVTKRISAQYVDVLARASARLLSGDADEQALAQLTGALRNLERLATAGGDAEHLLLLSELQAAVDIHTERLDTGKGESAFLGMLHRWLRAYAEFLDVDQARAIHRLMGVDADEVPLLRRLAALRGIGPRRLERLYAAGLYDVERLAEADARDVASVTGLPAMLAERVVVEADRHRTRQRITLITEMQSRVDSFIDEVRRLDASADTTHERAVREALIAMSNALSALGGLS